MREPPDAGDASGHPRPIGGMAALVVVVLVIEIVLLGLLSRGCA